MAIPAIHRLAYRRTNHRNLHVRGYKEKGNINTPMELAINNQTDRFSLAIDAIDRIPRLQQIGAHAKEEFRDSQIACRRHAYEHGIDSPEISGWKGLTARNEARHRTVTTRTGAGASTRAEHAGR